MADFDAWVKQTAEGLSDDARELLCDLYEQEEIDMDELYEPAADELVMAGLARCIRPSRSISTYLDFKRSKFSLAVHAICSASADDGKGKTG